MVGGISWEVALTDKQRNSSKPAGLKASIFQLQERAVHITLENSGEVDVSGKGFSLAENSQWSSDVRKHYTGIHATKEKYRNVAGVYKDGVRKAVFISK